jgi:putative ABC transport system substrate-binding protein
MRRRDFIAGVAGLASAWPLAARAQQAERPRRIGVLMSTAADDPEGRARIAAFLGGLQLLGWTDGHNAQSEVRWPRAKRKLANMQRNWSRSRRT